MQDGKIKNDRRKRAKATVPVGKEVQLNQLLGADEITVAINPVSPSQVIAGANHNAGQEMYFSSDGGTTWTIQGVLPDTCCDPTVEWSSDGGVAYAASLSDTIGVSTWRSFDAGQTWVDRVELGTSGSDKEFIHVDKSSSSPYQDSIYVTYHTGSVMQFARSINGGTSYDTQSLPEAPDGIGSDITTDSAGSIYYFYAAFLPQQVVLLKSTDGGTTFGTAVEVAPTKGEFDFPIPSMETRRAWIYASADADRSGGTFDGSIYVAWTDTVDVEVDSDPDSNHTRVYVANSRDGGANWNLSTPHSTSDMMTVDRWNQWLSVDEYGNVHVVFYDTRNSVDRTGVDLYYAYSADGGVSWSDPERVSTATSANLTDQQEFGDYNGLAVVADKVISSWTDNREGPPNQKDVYTEGVTNVVASPGFTLRADPINQTVCAPTDLGDIMVTVGSVQDFVEPVMLNLGNLPGGFTGGFLTNPVAPGLPANSTALQMTLGMISSGDYGFDIDGTAIGANDRSVSINVRAFDSVPASAALLAPTDGAKDVSTAPVLTWASVQGADSYTVEFDDDPAFGSIDFTTQTNTTSVKPDVTVLSETTYYWRVRSDNVCGTSTSSPVFSFTTGLEFCRIGFGSIPDSGSNSDSMLISEIGEIADLDVALDVTHTRVGDLTFTLTNEDTGTSTVLMDRPGEPALGINGCSGDDVDVTLDDEGAAPVEDACATNPAISGRLTPQDPLSIFDGQQLSGNWRLDFADYATQGVGTLDRWCLAPTIPDPSIDTDNDGQTDAHEIRCGSDPEDETSVAPDNDADGIPDCVDSDDDNDGVPDEQDDFPFGQFDDAPPGSFAFSFIEALARAGITAGCGNGNYCPSAPVTRAQMAVFLERGMNGSGYSPPAASGTVFLDVGATDFAANFIEQLFIDGITAGCGNDNYCPNDTVTRDQMAVFLLRAKYSSAYSPPPAVGVFGDVPTDHWAAAWIEQLAAEGITAGCGGGDYCPGNEVTRDQMAVFLVRTFGL